MEYAISSFLPMMSPGRGYGRILRAVNISSDILSNLCYGPGAFFDIVNQQAKVTAPLCRAVERYAITPFPGCMGLFHGKSIFVRYSASLSGPAQPPRGQATAGFPRRGVVNWIPACAGMTINNVLNPKSSFRGPRSGNPELWPERCRRHGIAWGRSGRNSGSPPGGVRNDGLGGSGIRGPSPVTLRQAQGEGSG